jgi:hypothetical protein
MNVVGHGSQADWLKKSGGTGLCCVRFLSAGATHLQIW